jgi:hypothetical protein
MIGPGRGHALIGPRSASHLSARGVSIESSIRRTPTVVSRPPAADRSGNLAGAPHAPASDRRLRVADDSQLACVLGESGGSGHAFVAGRPPHERRHARGSLKNRSLTPCQLTGRRSDRGTGRCQFGSGRPGTRSGSGPPPVRSRSTPLPKTVSASLSRVRPQGGSACTVPGPAALSSLRIGNRAPLEWPQLESPPCAAASPHTPSPLRSAGPRAPAQGSLRPRRGRRYAIENGAQHAGPPRRRLLARARSGNLAVPVSSRVSPTRSNRGLTWSFSANGVSCLWLDNPVDASERTAESAEASYTGGLVRAQGRTGIPGAWARDCGTTPGAWEFHGYRLRRYGTGPLPLSAIGAVWSSSLIATMEAEHGVAAAGTGAMRSPAGPSRPTPAGRRSPGRRPTWPWLGTAATRAAQPPCSRAKAPDGAHPRPSTAALHLGRDLRSGHRRRTQAPARSPRSARPHPRATGQRLDGGR